MSNRNNSWNGRTSYGGGNHQAGGYYKGGVYKYQKVANCAICIEYEDGTERFHLSSDLALTKAIANGDFDFCEVHLDEKEEDWKYPAGEKSVLGISVKHKDVPQYITKSRSVACCAYNASSGFMEHWLGTKLDNDDRKWYELNELVTSDGLPQKNSFTVIQQLVEPYGHGISRIVVPRNARRFKEYHPFIVSLGANPMYIQDGSTTNEEAVQKMFPDDPKKQAEMRALHFPMWRFECSDEPMVGAIVMRQFNDYAGHNGGSNYFGPRSKIDAKGWAMSVRLDRLSNIKYLKAMELPAYKEYEGHKTPNYWQIKDATGKTLRELDNDIKEKERKERAAKWAGNTYPHNQQGRSGLVPQNNKPEAKLPASHNNAGSNYFTNGGRHSDRAKGIDPNKKESDLQNAPAWSGSTWEDSEGWNQQEFSSTDAEQGECQIAYPTICDLCQKSTGVHYVNGTRACQWCGTDIEMEIVQQEDIDTGVWVLVPEEDFYLESGVVDEPTDEASKLPELPLLAKKTL